MRSRNGIVLLVLLAGIACGVEPEGKLPSMNAVFESARAETSADRLTVSTGRVERTWRLTERGLATVSLRENGDAEDWAGEGSGFDCDWEIPGAIGPGRLLGLEAGRSNDEGFTGDHLKVTATFDYSADNLRVQYVIWAYPDAPGLRTQLRCRLIREREPAAAGEASPPESGRPGGGEAAAEGERVPVSGSPAAPQEHAAVDMARAEGIVDSLPVRWDSRTLHAVGYYSGTQNRNTRELKILREEEIPIPARTGEIDWASLLAVRDSEKGVLLVKESHKCVNTPGLGARTGRFAWNARGIRNTGVGWRGEDYTSDRYRSCWAAWTVLYRGGEDGMALTLKRFDRRRYPIDPERDIYILANTWGSSRDMRGARIQAREDNILVEIDSQADLGIDIQQIDDGWQGFDFDSWRPIRCNELRPDDAVYPLYKSDTFPVYPDGWSRVREYAREKGVKLGLWAAVRISAEDLIWNYERGDFRTFKLDYAHLGEMKDVDELMGKARRLILHSGHKVRINWDLTEKSPRVGYFFGREYGNIYLENRKPEWPAGVVYIPYLVLRDAWQLSRYVNLNKFQITVQNVDRVSRELSDAFQHPHDYCLAQTLMSSPIFFQETRYYDEKARKQLRPLIRIYKRHRKGMFRGYVFPIGDEPDNRSWSGFQNHDPETGKGYLTIFRQLENRSSRQRMALKFIGGRSIRIADLRTEKAWNVDVPKGGEVEFEIPRAPGYLFLKYTDERKERESR